MAIWRTNGALHQFSYRGTIFILKYWAAIIPYHTCPKIWTSSFYCTLMWFMTACWGADIVDPDQTPHLEGSSEVVVVVGILGHPHIGPQKGSHVHKQLAILYVRRDDFLGRAPRFGSSWGPSPCGPQVSIVRARLPSAPGHRSPLEKGTCACLQKW